MKALHLWLNGVVLLGLAALSCRVGPFAPTPTPTFTPTPTLTPTPTPTPPPTSTPTPTPVLLYEGYGLVVVEGPQGEWVIQDLEYGYQVALSERYLFVPPDPAFIEAMLAEIAQEDSQVAEELRQIIQASEAQTNLRFMAFYAGFFEPIPNLNVMVDPVFRLTENRIEFYLEAMYQNVRQTLGNALRDSAFLEVQENLYGVPIGGVYYVIEYLPGVVLSQYQVVFPSGTYTPILMTFTMALEQEELLIEDQNFLFNVLDNIQTFQP